MPVFDKEPNGLTRLAWERGRIPTIRLAFDAARQTNPSATLLLNDFDMSTAYECLIEGVPRGGHPGRRDRPAEPHAPGLLGRGARRWRILDRFARFGLPLHLTETTLLSGELMPAHIEDLNDHQVASWPSTPEGEARQADEIERHYRTLRRAPGGAGGDVLGDHRRGRLARCTRRARARRRHAQARLRRAAPAGEGRVVAAADDAADLLDRARAGERVPRHVLAWTGCPSSWGTTGRSSSGWKDDRVPVASLQPVTDPPTSGSPTTSP